MVKPAQRSRAARPSSALLALHLVLLAQVFPSGLCALDVDSARAQPDPSRAAEVPTGKLDAADPPRDDNDWVQMDNGEWLCGKLHDLRDGELSFSSDKFGDEQLKLSDVKRMFIRRKAELELVDRSQLIGTIEYADERFRVSGADGATSIPAKRVLGIVTTAGAERDRWSLKLSAGLNVARGNTSQQTLNGSATIKREGGLTRGQFDYLGNYGRSRGRRTTHNHRGVFTLDLFLVPKLFVTPCYALLEVDRVKNVALRSVSATGLGARLFDTGSIEWNVAALAGYLYLRSISAAGGDSVVPPHHALVVLNTSFDWQLNDHVDLHLEYTGSLVATDLGLSSHHLLTSLTTDVTDAIDFGLRFVLDRIEQPVQRQDGSRPRSNDYQAVANVGLRWN